MVRAQFNETLRRQGSPTPGGQTLHPPPVDNAQLHSPTDRFFMRHAVNGYTYHGRSPIVEWRALLRAKSWTFEQCKVNGSRQQALYHEYLEAVEDEVDYLIGQNEEVRDGGLEPWEYLCQFFGVGAAPLTKTKAKKVTTPDTLASQIT